MGQALPALRRGSRGGGVNHVCHHMVDMPTGLHAWWLYAPGKPWSSTHCAPLGTCAGKRPAPPVLRGSTMAPGNGGESGQSPVAYVHTDMTGSVDSRAMQVAVCTTGCVVFHGALPVVHWGVMDG